MKSRDRAKIVAAAAAHGSDWTVCKADLMLPSDRWFSARLETGGSNWDKTLFRCSLMIRPLFTPLSLHSVGYHVPVDASPEWSLRDLDHAAIGTLLRETLEEVWQQNWGLARIDTFIDFVQAHAKAQGMLKRGPDYRVERDLAGACAIIGQYERALLHCATARQLIFKYDDGESWNDPTMPVDYLDRIADAVRGGEGSTMRFFESIRLDNLRELGMDEIGG